MCEIKTVKIGAALLITATGFCIYQVNSEKKVGRNSYLKSESPFETEYRSYCLNGGEGC